MKELKMAKAKNSAKVINQGGFGGAYFFAMVGAAVYFVQNSAGFWGFILALLKAIAWPAFLVHSGFKLMGV
jgi:hypothetical protein